MHLTKNLLSIYSIAALAAILPFYGNAQDLPFSDLEPDELNIPECIELPYFETFSDATHYNGDSYLPDNWVGTGTNVFRTANMTDLPAKVGEWYMITPPVTDATRDERAYTPFFNLEAGTTYTATFHTFIQGTYDNIPQLKFTVGTQQDADFHTTLLNLENHFNTTLKWEEHTVTFTPEKSGPYCFAFMLSGDAPTGIVAIDDVRFTAPGLLPRVEPNFSPMGLFDLMDSQIVTFTGNSVPFINTTKYGISYRWDAPGAIPESTTLTHPHFWFPETGEYNISLTATNPRGTRTNTKKVMVKVLNPASGTELGLQIFNNAEDRVLNRYEIPHFETDEKDFIVGFNHYYFDVAQKYNFAEGDFLLENIQMWLMERNYAPDGTSHTQPNEPMSVVIYGCKPDGSLDENTVYGRKDGTIQDFFLTVPFSGGGGYQLAIELDEPAHILGPCYLALHFSHNMILDERADTRGRSYVGTSCIKYGSGHTTLYAKPYAVPEGSKAKADGNWYRIDQIDPSMQGYGAFWHMWVYVQGITEGLVALSPEGETVFDAIVKDGNLVVSGSTANETLTIYSITGTPLLKATGVETSTEIDIRTLPAGVYIISSVNGTKKFRK